MTQYHNPWYGRALSLKAAAAWKRDNKKSFHSTLRSIVSAAHAKGCCIREDDGSVIEVQPKWVISQIKEGIGGLPTGICIQYMISLLKRTRGNKKMLLTRRELDWLQQNHARAEARAERLVDKGRLERLAAAE